MGNFHCIPESCARVVWREYLPPKIRWRYPDEDWQEIEGDDYAIEQETGKCSTLYDVVYREQVYNISDCRIVINKLVTKAVYGTVGKPYFKLIETSNTFFSSCNGLNNSQVYLTEWFLPTGNGDIFLNGNVFVDLSNRASPPLSSYDIQSITRRDRLPDNCGDCIFTVYQNGQTVHQETRIGCPEVEKLDCHLSDEYKEIKIEKFPYLERIEVIDYAYDVRLGAINDIGDYGLLLFKEKIPDECLNIYKNNITSIIPNDFISITNTPENGFNLITQICSSPNCPPPEYQVICNCNDCESCPPETCPVECGEHICCYNDLGVSVKQIDINNYCG